VLNLLNAAPDVISLLAAASDVHSMLFLAQAHQIPQGKTASSLRHRNHQSFCASAASKSLKHRVLSEVTPARLILVSQRGMLRR